VKKRILAAIVIVPLIIFIVISKNPLFLTVGLSAVCGLLGLELFSLFNLKKDTPLLIITLVLTCAIPLIIYQQYMEGESFKTILLYEMFILFLTFFIPGTLFIFSGNFKGIFFKLSVSIFIVFYSGIVLSSLLHLKMENNAGLYYIIYLLLISWIYDSSAYIFGSLLKGKKLGLKASPNKTWSGTICGFILTAGLSLLYVFIIKEYFFTSIKETIIFKSSLFSNLPEFLIITIILIFAAQIGDLIESIIKRSFSKKDSGSLIPGHGGIFDAIDSLIPISFILTIYLQCRDIFF